MWMLFSGHDENGVGEWGKTTERPREKLQKALSRRLGWLQRRRRDREIQGSSTSQHFTCVPYFCPLLSDIEKSYLERLESLVVSPTPLLSSSTSKGSDYKVLVEGANALML